MKAISTHSHQRTPWPGRLSALLPGGLFMGFALQAPSIQAGRPLSMSLEWVPGLNVRFAFFLDGLGLLFALIITAIGLLVTIYADAYMSEHPQRNRFFLLLHAFLLSMVGLVLANDLMLLFVFWELTSLFSFLLIGFDHESAKARSSARQSLLVTGGGGLLLLVGIIMFGHVTGTYVMSEHSRYADQLHHHSLYLPILFCMLAGAFTKSAQFPFHFWLPNAMAAPTPISAFLHSATMVKAGIYLLARLHPVMGGTTAWMTTLVIVGALTALWGAIVSLARTELKSVLAQTTIMALGIMTMFLGGSSTPALTAAMTFLLVHALYKSSLFMVAGAIDHQTGTREISQIGGLARHMPLTAAATLFATLSMAGFPLFIGFVGKEIMYKGALSEGVFSGLATITALISNALMTAVAATLLVRPFWGRQRKARPSGEAPWQIWFGPLLIGGTCLGFGLIPDWVGHWLVEPAVRAIDANSADIELKLFYGFNTPLLLSIATIIIGSVVYLNRRWLRRNLIRLFAALPLTIDGLYDWLEKTIVAFAAWQTRQLQNGSLYRYLVIIIGTTVVVVGWALFTSGKVIEHWRWPVFSVWLGLLLISMLISIGIVVRTKSRILAICGLGVIGAGVAILFLSHGAPDVGLTQLLVETLTLIIVAIVLLRLPPIKHQVSSGRFQQTLRVAVSIGSGFVVTALLLTIIPYDVDRTITAFYEQASYLEAHGRNIVNVILVDFRSLDTLGEIIVVAASALAALALIRGKGPAS
jgi:multicomponent Na+:H+ antiporter subunit A